DQFDLVGASRDRVDLRESIAWSWDQLDEAERRALRQCSVFASPFSLEAAEFVLDLTDTDPPVFDLLQDLAAASWLKTRRPSGGRVQFEWLRTLRAFADAELRESGEAEATHRRHTDYVVRTARQMRDQLHTMTGPELAARLEDRADEMLAVCDRLGASAPEEVYTILTAFRWPTTLGRSSVERVQPRLTRLLDQLDPDRHPEKVARLAAWAAELAIEADDHDRSADWAARAESAAGEHDEPGLIADIQHAKSLTLARVDPDLARNRLQRALAPFVDGRADTGADWLYEGRLRERLGFLALERFDLETAEEHFRTRRQRLAGRGHPLMTTGLHSGLGWVQFRRGRGRAAIAGLRRTAQLEAELGSASSEASARFNLGACLHALGELEAAEQAWDRAGNLWERAGERGYEVLLVVRRGLVALERGELARARRQLEDAASTPGSSARFSTRSRRPATPMPSPPCAAFRRSPTPEPDAPNGPPTNSARSEASSRSSATRIGIFAPRSPPSSTSSGASSRPPPPSTPDASNRSWRRSIRRWRRASTRSSGAIPPPRRRAISGTITCDC
ncbi:MAG: hypothetical protein ABEN55_23920, partial [Bradymonadaceae bacterium]